MAPGRFWRRSYSTIYNDNYTFGGNLYSDALESVGRSSELLTPLPVDNAVPAPHVQRPDSDRHEKHLSAMTLRRVQSSADIITKPIDQESCVDAAMEEARESRIRRRKRREVFSFHGEHLNFMEERRQILKDEEEKLKSVEKVENTQIPVSAPTVVEMQERHSIATEVAQWKEICKQMQIEIEHLNQRLAEAEAKLKTEVARIKKKMQAQITELEMSLDAANKQNLDLQKTIKKQALHITELQAHYDEIHRQLQQTTDQLGISQRRCQGLQAELDEMRTSLEQALRGKRAAEMLYEEANTRVNELTTINVNLVAAKGKLEGDYASLQSEYDDVQKELRILDERLQKALMELKVTKDALVEEQERFVKVESIKKSLEMEVHNLQVRIEEVEANAVAGGKRVIAKLESRIRDIEIELEEEKRRHSETLKVMRKKELRVRELMLQSEEDHKALSMLNDSCDKLTEKVKMYKRQLAEQEGLSQQNINRVRRFQRELEAAEDRADSAESNLSMIRAKHRTWVTTSQIPGGVRQVFVTEDQVPF